MPLDQWLLKFDPANLTLTAFLFILLVTFIVFVFTRWWPWYTKEDYPARQKERLAKIELEARQEERRQLAMEKVGDALIKLELLYMQGQAAQLMQGTKLDEIAGNIIRIQAGGK